MQEDAEFREIAISTFSRFRVFGPPRGVPFGTKKGTIKRGVGARFRANFSEKLKYHWLDQLLRHCEILQRGKRRPHFSEVSVAPRILLENQMCMEFIRPDTKSRGANFWPGRGPPGAPLFRVSRFSRFLIFWISCFLDFLDFLFLFDAQPRFLTWRPAPDAKPSMIHRVHL